jgi:trigger factor
MNITKTSVDDLSITLSVKISKTDYEESVSKILKEHRRKAHMPGFRQGCVPMSIVQKMYGKAVIYDEVFKTLDKAVSDYLNENHLRILGDPVPSENSPTLDFDTQEDFEFLYDFALRPALNLNPADITIPYYNINITDELVKKTLADKQRLYGKMTDIECVADSEFLLYADVSQEDKNGINVQNGLLSSTIMTEPQKKKFIGLKPTEHINANIREILPNDADCASFLNIKKDALPSINPEVMLTIKRICKIVPAELNQDFFDRVFGKDKVVNETECMSILTKEMSEDMMQHSDSLFAKNVRQALIEQANITLSESILKRWLKLQKKHKEQSNKSSKTSDSDAVSDELQFDNEATTFFETLRWSLIVEDIATKNDIRVGNDDITQYTRNNVIQGLAWYYDLSQIDDSIIESHVERKLEDDNYRRHTAEHILVSKVLSLLKNIVKLDMQNVSYEEFEKILQETTMASAN